MWFLHFFLMLFVMTDAPKEMPRILQIPNYSDLQALEILKDENHIQHQKVFGLLLNQIREAGQKIIKKRYIDVSADEIENYMSIHISDIWQKKDFLLERLENYSVEDGSLVFYAGYLGYINGRFGDYLIKLSSNKDNTMVSIEFFDTSTIKTERPPEKQSYKICLNFPKIQTGESKSLTQTMLALVANLYPILDKDSASFQLAEKAGLAIEGGQWSKLDEFHEIAEKESLLRLRGFRNSEDVEEEEDLRLIKREERKAQEEQESLRLSPEQLALVLNVSIVNSYQIRTRTKLLLSEYLENGNIEEV